MLPLLAAIGLGVKGIFDAKREERNKQAQAMSDSKAIQFSPWSGLDASKLVGKDYSSQSPISALLAGGASGAVTGMNIENSMADNALAQQKAEYYKSRIPAAAGKVEAASPYAGLELLPEEPDYLKGQAVRRIPYGMGLGDV